jgi:hypothetical protein
VIVRHRLELLGRWRGDVRDALFAFSLTYALESAGVWKLFDNLEWRHAYLGRYMGITPDKLEDTPVRTIRRYLGHLSDIVKRENGPTPKGAKEYL